MALYEGLTNTILKPAIDSRSGGTLGMFNKDSSEFFSTCAALDRFSNGDPILRVTLSIPFGAA